MAWPDGESDGKNPFVSVAPTYAPAAVGARGAWWGRELEWPASPLTGVPRIQNVWFADDGVTLRLHLDDGSVASAPQQRGRICRFLRPREARAMDLTPDGKTVLVLNADGRIDAWSLPPFGGDGWIAQSGGY
jgi:hypothetical protein